MSDTLKLLREFRERFSNQKFRHRKGVNLDADLTTLSELLDDELSLLEYGLLKGAVYEAYVKNRVFIPEHEGNIGADRAVVFFYYRRKLAQTAAAYPCMHYYENYLRRALSVFISEKLGTDWLREALKFLNVEYGQKYDYGTESLSIFAPNHKLIIRALSKDSVGVSNPFYKLIFENILAFFKQLVRKAESKSEVTRSIENASVQFFLSSLSIDSLQKMVLFQWHLLVTRSDFAHAKKNGLYKTQLRDAFKIVSRYRNDAYHHVGSAGPARAIKKMKLLVPFPEMLLHEYNFAQKQLMRQNSGAVLTASRRRQVTLPSSGQSTDRWKIGAKVIDIEEACSAVVLDVTSLERIRIGYTDGETKWTSTKTLTLVAD